MQLRVFQYSIPAPEQLSDLNHYLASHRITSLTHHLVPAVAGGGTLVFVVESADSPASFAQPKPAEKRGQIRPTHKTYDRYPTVH